MPTNTTTYSFQKPVVGADEDSWGGYLNSNWDKVDDLFDGTTAITGIDINSGTIDGTVIGGSSAAAVTGTTGQFNTSLNVDGTITSDGLAVDGDGLFQGNSGMASGSGTPVTLQIKDTSSGSSWVAGDVHAALDFFSSDGSGVGNGVRGRIGIAQETTVGGVSSVNIQVASTTAGTLQTALKADYNGDISFFEDTGTTAKFLWDASAESLGIGTSSPAALLNLAGSNSGSARNVVLRLEDTDVTVADGDIAGAIEFYTNDATIRRETAVIEARYTGAAGSSKLHFKTGAIGSITDSMVIDTVGNVGIGTSSPSVKLEVEGDSGAQSGTVTTPVTIRLTDTASNQSGTVDTTNPYAKLEFYSRDTSNEGPITQAYIGAVYDDQYSAGSELSFATWNAGNASASERLRIDSSGFIKAVTSITSDPTDTGSYWYNKSGVGPTLSGFQFSVRTGGTPTERLRVDSSGNLLVGTTTVGSGDGVSLGSGENRTFHRATTSTVNQIKFANSNGIVGSIKTGGSSTSYITSSDYRLKEDVQPMTGASDRVLALKPVNFAWKADGTRVDGFLAHELQEVVPEAATGTKDAMREEEYEVTPAVLDEDGNVVTEAVMGTRQVPDYQGIDQSKLVPLLTAALQEALTKIDALEARIAALEGN